MRPGMRPLAERLVTRHAAMRSTSPLVPTGECHMCGWTNLPKGAHWCSRSCHDDFQQEKAELLGAK